MISEPLVSVVINCFNGEQFVKSALDSVLNQTYKNLEIIFIDNLSTDQTCEIVKSYTDSRIKYFCLDKHVSLGTSRNFALSNLNGSYISFLDVDDLWYANKLSEQILIFKSSKVGLVYSLTDKINSDGKIIFKPKYDKNSKNSLLTFKDLFLKYDIVMSSSIFSKKALTLLNQKFDELLSYSEEFDLFMRISCNYDVVRVNKILASYRIHENQSTNSMFEKSIKEEEYILSKLSILYPRLIESNKESLYRKYEILAWNNFLLNISKGKYVYARKKIKPYIFSSIKYFIFFLLSFFGKKIILFLWDYKRKNNYNIEFDH
jgi:glycosyltransferase involved in cell wall biosynthesis